MSDLLNNDSQVIHSADYRSTFIKDCDTTQEKAKLVEQWKKMNDLEKGPYNNKIEKFFREMLPKISSEDEIKSKSYNIVSSEVQARIEREPDFEQLNINSVSLIHQIDELLENIENTNRIKEIYRKRKMTTGITKNAGISTEEANKIKNCLRQGRELLKSARVGALMIKPLNYFYSLTAYSYAVAILNNPIRYGLHTLASSHGLQFLKSEFSVRFGMDLPQGTFTELVTAFPSILNKNQDFSFTQNNIHSIEDFNNLSIKVGIGSLLSLIPEIKEYYKMTTSKDSRAHPMEIESSSTTRNPIYKFSIGDGISKPSAQVLQDAFPNGKIDNKYGRVVIEVQSADLHYIKAMIWTDSSGKFWYIDNPFYPLVLSDIAVHFLLINSLSNIMRYYPSDWGDILLNEGDASSSILLKRYLSTLEISLPFMILRYTSDFWPYMN